MPAKTCIFNQEIHSMAIISQDTIKLGCSGGQGKIQIQTFFVLGTPCGEHAAQLVQQMSRILYKLVHLWRDRPVFMQNKANLLDAQMNVSSVLTTYYENKSNWTPGENKPNSNPIKANFRKAKMNANLCGKKDYEKRPCLGLRKNKAKTKPILRLRSGQVFRLSLCL